MSDGAMTGPGDERGRRSIDLDAGTRAAHSARRNVRLALIHGAIALGFLLLFVWSQLRS